MFATILAAIILTFVPVTDPPPVTYTVVGTGDSILELSADYLTVPGRYYNFESGRQPYVTGLRDEHTTASIVPSLIGLLAPGGWLLVQDNGANATDTEWRTLMADIVRMLPDDRCLAVILPVFHPDWAPDAFDDTERRATIMTEETEIQPCHAVIDWRTAVLNDPGLVYDGQHPTDTGARWLGAQVDRVVGRRWCPFPGVIGTNMLLAPAVRVGR